MGYLSLRVVQRDQRTSLFFKRSYVVLMFLVGVSAILAAWGVLEHGCDNDYIPVAYITFGVSSVAIIFSVVMHIFWKNAWMTNQWLTVGEDVEDESPAYLSQKGAEMADRASKRMLDIDNQLYDLKKRVNRVKGA